MMLQLLKRKTVFWALLMTVILLVQVPQADADPEKMTRKFARGLLNITTGWLEVPYRMEKSWNDDGPLVALTRGVIEGVGRTVGRVLVGTYEVISAPIPGPENYEPIMTDPVYFLANTDD